MATFIDEPSRTFGEYLLIPGYTSRECVPSKITLETPLVKYAKNKNPDISLNIPLVSAIMQSVSDDNMAIALAKEGGLSFIYCSQPIENEARMIAKVKNYKAGFVPSDANLRPESTLADVLKLKAKTGHSTMPVTTDGSPNGELLGLVTTRDYRPSRMDPGVSVRTFMTRFDDLICAPDTVTLSEANDIIWEHKLNVLPVVGDDRRLKYFVFRKDYENHKENAQELLDPKKRYLVGAGINTRDFEKRVPALLDAGADALCVDSSEGHTQWQADTLQWIRKNYGDEVKVGGGNVVDQDGFMFLVKAGADFVKVGIGGGSICTTREQKGIGRGQASALIDVAMARKKYFEETGIYVPICSDGGIVLDYHMILALAMGADFMMMGRYFARFDESPTSRVLVGSVYMKEYWGEGSNRAKNWQRYDDNEEEKLSFEEGVDSYVPYAGRLKDNVNASLSKLKATMCNCGVMSIAQLQTDAKLTVVSSTSIVEGGYHDVVVKEGLPSAY